MDIHVHTKEAPNERPHVHVLKRGKPSENDLKIWLDTLDIDPGRSRLKPKEIALALRSVRLFRKDLMALWVETHGQPQLRSRKLAKKKSNKNKA